MINMDTHFYTQYLTLPPLFPKSKVEQVPGGLTFVATSVDRAFWRGTGSIRSILQKRSENAGLPYFHPHTFRHTAIYLAMKRCQNAEEIKAVSQNFGHEHVGTTMLTYGTLDQFRVADVIGGIDFSGNSSRKNGDISLEELKAFVREREKGLD